MTTHELITTVISEVGFPIVAFLLMYWYAFVAIERNTKAMERLGMAYEESQPGETPEWVKEHKEEETVSPIPWLNKFK